MEDSSAGAEEVAREKRFSGRGEGAGGEMAGRVSTWRSGVARGVEPEAEEDMAAAAGVKSRVEGSESAARRVVARANGVEAGAKGVEAEVEGVEKVGGRLEADSSSLSCS